MPALLGVLDGLTGGDLAADLPLSILSQVTEHVAALSKRKAPKLLQQKRAFVRGWHTDTRQLLGGNGGSAPTPGRFVGDGAADAATLFSELDARLKRQQRSVTQTELPDAVLSHYATSVAAIVGTPLPTSQHERCELVYRWYEHYGRG